jgi:hypothetical protein
MVGRAEKPVRSISRRSTERPRLPQLPRAHEACTHRHIDDWANRLKD